MREKTIACLLGDGFEDSEFRVPFDRLRAAGYEVEIVGARKGQGVRGLHGRETVLADAGIDGVSPDDYEGLLIPGGHSPDRLRADPRFVDFVRRFDATRRPLGAVCHGPQLLLTAGLVGGRTLTAWPTVRGDLHQAGASVRDEPVVVDGNWITSREPDDLAQFSDALVERLGEFERGAAWWGEPAPAPV